VLESALLHSGSSANSAIWPIVYQKNRPLRRFGYLVDETLNSPKRTIHTWTLERIMRTYLIITTLLLLFDACQPIRNEIVFFADEEQDTIYRYQEGKGYFVANDLVNQLKSGEVLGAKLKLSVPKFHHYDETELTKKNFYLTDSLYYDLKGGILFPDDSVEQVGQDPEQFVYVGELEVYYLNGDSISYLDSICFTLVEPVNSNKMLGSLVKGIREGRWLEFNDLQKSDLARSSIFKNGLRNGIDTVFKGNSPYIISSWNAGKKDGYYKSYYPNGEINSEMLFVEGQPVEPMLFYSNKGVLIDSAYLFSENPTETFTSGSTTP
jgi:hypothetical protein